MKAIGKATGELAKIAKKETKFDAATVKANAEIIHDKLGAAKARPLRGQRPGARASRPALPEIWTDHAHLLAPSTRAEAASLAMSKGPHQRKGVHAGSR